MSDSTPPDLVSVELPYATWAQIQQLLVSYDEESRAADALCVAIDALEVPAPTGYGAVIRADVRGLGEVHLLLADPGAEWPWRTSDGDWFKADQFQVLYVVHEGVTQP